MTHFLTNISGIPAGISASVFGRVLGLVGAALVLAGCSAAPTHLKDQESDISVVGGWQVGPNVRETATYRSTVALTTPKMRQKGHSFCSGTLITSRIVLTAAHCLVDDSGQPLDYEGDALAVFGSKVSNAAAGRKVVARLAHPDYDPVMTLTPNAPQPGNDIGLVVLEGEAPNGFEPVALYQGELQSKDLFVAGYGVSLNRVFNDTGTLRAVNFRLSKLMNQALRFGGNKFLKGSCAGDSGGPVYVKTNDTWFVTGVVSSGAEFASFCYGDNEYTDARKYADWIQSSIQSL